MVKNCATRGASATDSGNIKVIVRVRPPNKKETTQNYKPAVEITDEYNIIFDPKVCDEPFYYHGVQQRSCNILKKPNKHIEFQFDRVFGYECDNNYVFNNSIKDLIDSLMNGFNCSVFAYGATGAGKTHTMLGQNGNPGITILTMNELFKQMEHLQQERTFELGITYVEVYNETVKDLLNPGVPVFLREDGKLGVCISGIKMHQITNVDELFALLAKGNNNRTQHPTDANSESSRSHAVFQVYVDIKYRCSSECRFAKLSMIDLAGSERGSATGCKGMRFKEGANINRSLLALGNCINSLADGQKYVPYRDSKLTRLLKDSIGGNCRTIMLANISPTHFNYEDTYNTLKYALRAKKIKSNTKENVIDKHLTGTQYIKIIEGLRTELETWKKKYYEKEKENKELLVWKDKNSELSNDAVIGRSNEEKNVTKEKTPTVSPDKGSGKRNVAELFVLLADIETKHKRFKPASESELALPKIRKNESKTLSMLNETVVLSEPLVTNKTINALPKVVVPVKKPLKSILKNSNKSGYADNTLPKVCKSKRRSNSLKLKTTSKENNTMRITANKISRTHRVPLRLHNTQLDKCDKKKTKTCKLT